MVCGKNWQDSAIHCKGDETMPKYKAKIAFFAEYNATVFAPSKESSMAIAEREFLTQAKPMLGDLGITNVEISFEDVKEV